MFYLLILLTSLHLTRSPRPSPFVFACWIKYWRWQRPANGTKLNLYTVSKLFVTLCTLNKQCTLGYIPSLLIAYLIILHLICCIFTPCLLCPLHKWPDTVYKDLCCQKLVSAVKKLLLPLLYNKRECLTLKCPRGKFISHCVAGHTHILQVVVGRGKGEP